MRLVRLLNVSVSVNHEYIHFFNKKPRPSKAKSAKKDKKLSGLKLRVLTYFLPYNVLDFLIFSSFPGNWRKIGEN